MFDEVGELAVGQLVLVGPARVAENPVEGVGVGLLDLPERGLQSSADVVGVTAHVFPKAARWDREAVVLGEEREFVVPTRLVEGLRVLLQ